MRPYLFDVTTSPYDATGDGITDDTAAIQSAIDAAGANGGGIVLFPPGHYLITAPLQINYPGIIIQGSGITDGNGGTSIYASPDIDCFVGSGYPAGETAGLCIRDIHITYLPASTTAGSAIKIQWASRCWFERILIDNCYNALSIGQDGVTSSTINEVWFDKIDVRLASGAVIDMHGMGGDVFITNMFGGGVPTSAQSYALQFNNSYYDTFWMNHIDYEQMYGGMNFACYSSSTPDAGLSDFCISDIILDNIDGDRALKFEAGEATARLTRGQIRNIWATGQGGGPGGITCFVNEQPGAVIWDLNFSGCNFECSTGAAVAVNGASFIEFDNCKVSGSQRGFAIGASSNITIQGCKNGPYGPNQTDVVIYDSMTGPFFVHDNDWDSFSVRAVENDASAAVNQVSRLENNYGYNPVGFLASPPTYTDGVASTNPFPFSVMVVVTGATDVQINGTDTGSGAGSYVLGRGQTITPTGSGSWVWFGL